MQFLFIVLISDLGFDGQTNNIGEIATRKLKVMNEIHLKYVDDLTIAEKINLKEALVKVDGDNRPQPGSYHAWTGHVLKPSNSKVFDQLNNIEHYANENGMKLNHKKTKLMVFNEAKTKDFMPSFVMNGNELDVVEETKLLGVVITSDMK